MTVEVVESRPAVPARAQATPVALKLELDTEPSLELEFEKASAGWVLALTSVASFMVALDTLVVTNALSTIRVDLGASIEALQWTANAYNLSFAVLLMTGAALGDYLGRRRMLVAGLVLFTAASAGAAISPNVGWLIAMRAVQGAGGALVLPLALALSGVVGVSGPHAGFGVVRSTLGAQSAGVLLRAEFRLAHGRRSGSLDGLTGEMAADCARLVLCEDLAINGFLATRTPLALSTWRGRTGLSELPRLAAPIDWGTWAGRVQFEPAHFQSYAQAVYAATDAYLLQEHPEWTTCLLKAVLCAVTRTSLLQIPSQRARAGAAPAARQRCTWRYRQ